MPVADFCTQEEENMAVLESEIRTMFPTLFFVLKLNPASVFQTIFLSFSFDMDNYLQNH